MIYKPLEDISIGIDAPIAQEGPPASHILRVLEVEFDDDALFLMAVGLIDDLSLRTSEEGSAPELDSFRLTTGIWLETYTVNCEDGQTVGNGMTTHHRLPGSALALLFLCGVVGGIADGSGVD